MDASARFPAELERGLTGRVASKAQTRPTVFSNSFEKLREAFKLKTALHHDVWSNRMFSILPAPLPPQAKLCGLDAVCASGCCVCLGAGHYLCPHSLLAALLRCDRATGSALRRS